MITSNRWSPNSMPFVVETCFGNNHELASPLEIVERLDDDSDDCTPYDINEYCFMRTRNENDGNGLDDYSCCKTFDESSSSSTTDQTNTSSTTEDWTNQGDHYSSTIMERTQQSSFAPCDRRRVTISYPYYKQTELPPRQQAYHGGASPTSVLQSFCSYPSKPPSRFPHESVMMEEHRHRDEVLIPPSYSLHPSLVPLQTSQNQRDKSITKKVGVLPSSFVPGPYSVIIGRGKETKGAIGNLRLKILASTFLPKYSSAPNKAAKSKIVGTILSMIHEACPLGAFIRLGKDGRWHEVKTPVATEKVGYTMRELLGEQYKSSSKTKALVRRLVSTTKRGKGENDVKELSTSSTSTSDVVALVSEQDSGQLVDTDDEVSHQ